MQLALERRQEAEEGGRDVRVKRSSDEALWEIECL